MGETFPAHGGIQHTCRGSGAGGPDQSASCRKQHSLTFTLQFKLVYHISAIFSLNYAVAHTIFGQISRYPLNQGRRQLRLTSSQGTWLKPRDGATSSAVNHRSMAQLSRRHRQRQKSGSVGWCCWCINCIIWFNQQRKNQLSLILLEVGCIWLYDVIWNHPN